MAHESDVLRAEVYGIVTKRMTRRIRMPLCLEVKLATAVGDSGKALAKGVHLRVCYEGPSKSASITLLLDERDFTKTNDCGVESDDEGEGYDLSALSLQNPVAYVESMDDHLIVFSEHLQAPEDSQHFIVYDATRKSLDVVPRPSPWYCSYSFAPGPFPVRSQDGNYALATMVRLNIYDMVLRREVLEDALCLWPPPPSSRPHPQGCIHPWQLKKPSFPKEKPDYFSADITFCFKGQAFWIDLGQGVLSCDCDQVLYGDYEVQYRYIPLPPECRLGQGCESMGIISLRSNRTMSFGSGDGSLKFVCIGKGCDCDGCGGPENPQEILVAMWVLDLPSGLWRRDDGSNEFPVASLWEKADFKKAGLPQALPMFPVLSTHQGGDISLYFNIEKMEGTSSGALLCRINVRTKDFMICGSFPRLPTEQSVFASNFFRNISNLGLFV